jgi:hypothetical protein
LSFFNRKIGEEKNPNEERGKVEENKNEHMGVKQRSLAAYRKYNNHRKQILEY